MSAPPPPGDAGATTSLCPIPWKLNLLGSVAQVAVDRCPTCYSRAHHRTNIKKLKRRCCPPCPHATMAHVEYDVWLMDDTLRTTPARFGSMAIVGRLLLRFAIAPKTKSRGAIEPEWVGIRSRAWLMNSTTWSTCVWGACGARWGSSNANKFKCSSMFAISCARQP